MLDLETTAATPREDLLGLLRSRLHRVVPEGRLIAEGILGLDARIDFVLTEPSGRVILVLVGAEGRDLALVGRGLAQSAWVSERLADWHQLAPGLGIRPEAGVTVCLLAPAFSDEARGAARSLGNQAIRLIRFHGVRSGAGVDVLIEPPATATPPEVPSSAVRGVIPPSEELLGGNAPGAGDPPAAEPVTSEPAESADASTDRGPARFRTGLTDRDLGLTREERGEFE